MSATARLLDWHADPVVVAGLTALGVLWAVGVSRVHRTGGRVAADRRWAFAAAYAVLVLSLLSPLAAVSEERFSAHMVQHLLLLYVAAPLLALSAPVTLALQASSAGVRRDVVLPALHSRPVRAVTHPAVAFVAFAGVMYATHFSGVYDAALRSDAVHGLEHLLYLAAAALFWWPVIRRDPVPGRFPWPARLLYLVLALPLQSFLGLAIYSTDRVLYDSYLGQGTAADVLADQQVAGAIMWVGGDLLSLVAIGFALVAWMRAEERATERLDAQLDAARAR